MEILISVKNNYGSKMYYPECKNSEAFASIAGTITLTKNVIQLIKELGYTIKVKQDVEVV